VASTVILAEAAGPLEPQRLRRLRRSDRAELVELYRDAVSSQAVGLYSEAQIQAWAQHADHGADLAAALERGYGLASLGDPPADPIEAFGLLDPPDRLSLLYCRGRSCRQGRASALLQALEQEARRRGIRRLRTEASQLSRPLLQRRGWQLEAEEEVLFARVRFRRWRMIRPLD
jgi:GNAT superfamily N-acetyltransferase